MTINSTIGRTDIYKSNNPVYGKKEKKRINKLFSISTPPID